VYPRRSVPPGPSSARRTSHPFPRRIPACRVWEALSPVCCAERSPSSPCPLRSFAPQSRMSSPRLRKPLAPRSSVSSPCLRKPFAPRSSVSSPCLRKPFAPQSRMQYWTHFSSGSGLVVMRAVPVPTRSGAGVKASPGSECKRRPLRSSSRPQSGVSRGLRVQAVGPLIKSFQAKGFQFGSLAVRSRQALNRPAQTECRV
jgi:hypothetical protein